MSLCSELENMNISISYYNFIKEVFDDYIKSVTYYKEITIDYIKKLNLFQEKYSNKLNGKDNIKYKEINKSHTYSIISPINKLVKKQIEQLDIFILGINSQLDKYKSMFGETKILSSKFQSIFDDASKDLLKKYRDIDKARDNFKSCMDNTKLIIKKYMINEKDNNSTSYNDVITAINNSKKYAKEYKNLINTVKTYEDNFDTSYLSSIESMKKLTSETSEKLKDFVLNLILFFQNNNKMQLSEIDIFLPELSKLNETEEIEKIMENSYKKDNKLCHVKRDKYKFKLFQDNNNAEEDAKISDKILKLEDGIQEMIVIKDENILSFLKKMKNDLVLIEYDFDLDIEEEKFKCLKLSDKILELETNNIIPTEEEVNQLNTLLDKHHNRVVFLQKLSQYRNNGKFEIKPQTFEIFTQLFNTIIDKIDRDNDYYSVKNAIIISQTYYIKLKDNEKKYLQKMIQNNQLFKSKKFWEDFLNFSINNEIATCAHNDYKNGNIEKENQKEADDKKSNIAFSQILPYADNMIEFGLDKNIIQEVIFPKMDEFKMSKELSESIKAIINGKK